MKRKTECKMIRRRDLLAAWRCQIRRRRRFSAAEAEAHLSRPWLSGLVGTCIPEKGAKKNLDARKKEQDQAGT